MNALSYLNAPSLKIPHSLTFFFLFPWFPTTDVHYVLDFNYSGELFKLNMEALDWLRDSILREADRASTFDPRDVKRLKLESSLLTRFLNAREKREQSLELLIQALTWRKENFVVDTKDNMDLAGSDIFFFHGLDHDNQQLAVFRASCFDKSEAAMALTKKKVFHQLENVMPKLGPSGKITLIFDMNNCDMSHIDLGFLKFFFDCFTKYYPGILDKFLLLELSWAMSAVHAFINSWLTPEMLQKLVKVSTRQLVEHIDSNQLPSIYQGPPGDNSLQAVESDDNETQPQGFQADTTNYNTEPIPPPAESLPEAKKKN